MSLPSYLRSVAAKFFRRSELGDEIEEELRSHIQHRSDDLERSGMPRAEAERRARIELGNRDKFRQESYEALGGNFIESILQDIRISLRVLRKSPAFAITAILTLTLAIGANAVVFSILNTLVLRPPNVPHAQNLYMVEQNGQPSQSYPDYIDLRDRNRAFDGMAIYSMASAGLDAGSNPSSLWLYETSGNYFDVLGVKPYLGRFFHGADEHGPNSAPYIVLSYAYWHSHFHSDPKVVGRVVQLNKFPYTILGVAQPNFRGTVLFFSPALWIPVVNQQQIQGSSDLNQRGARGMWVLGRLKQGVTPAQATADLSSIAARLAKTYPKEDDSLHFSLARPGLLGDFLGGPIRAFLLGLMLLALLILLAACANLGSLFAARAAERGHEIALRLALGSSRRRILRQLLTEAFIVSLAGGTLGLIGSIVLLRWLSAWQPIPNIPINVAVSPDARCYLFALFLALASGLLSAIVPVRQVSKSNPYQIIKIGAGPGRLRRISTRDLLLAAQIAICAVLVTASLVAVRGLARSLRSNFGFDPHHAMQVNTDLDMAGYTGDRAVAMQRHMIDAVTTIPGVTAAAYADRIPLNLGWSDSSVYREGTTDYRESNAVSYAVQYSVSPGYFRAAATTLLAGRSFTWHDDSKAPRVAVINEEFARKIFGTPQKAMGGYFKLWGGTRVHVVGIVEDGKYETLAEDPMPAMFLSILQSPSTNTYMIVRSNRSPQEIAAALDRTLHGLDPSLPLTINTWDREMNSALFAPRVATIALGVLGLLGAMLSITGIFGMAAYLVSKRLRELGIRIALGAQRREILQTALGRALKLLAFGSAIGLLLGILASRVLASIVYQAKSSDPLVLSGVVLVMMLVGLIATWIPALRALSADPVRLLRDQ
ncbi:MAG: ADOP family duplicated permease [Acidobacteriaceae bacterium]